MDAQRGLLELLERFQVNAPAVVEQTRMGRLAFFIGNFVIVFVPMALIALVTVFFWWLIFHRNSCNFRFWVQQGFAPFDRTLLVNPKWVMYTELGKQKREMDEEKKKQAIQQLKVEHVVEMREQHDWLQSKIQPLCDEKTRLENMLRGIHGRHQDKLENLDAASQEIRIQSVAYRKLEDEMKSKVNETKLAQDQLCSEREANETKCDEHRDEHDKSLANTKAEHDHDLAKLKSEHEKELDDLRDHYKQQLDKKDTGLIEKLGGQSRQKTHMADLRTRAARGTAQFHQMRTINMSQKKANGIRRRANGKYDSSISGIVKKICRTLEERFDQKVNARVEEIRRELEEERRKRHTQGDMSKSKGDGNDGSDDDDENHEGGNGEKDASTKIQPLPGKAQVHETNNSSEDTRPRNGSNNKNNSRPSGDVDAAAENQPVKEAEQTRGSQDTSEEEKERTSPDSFSQESRHFYTSAKSKASETLPLGSNDSVADGSGDDANARILSEILAPLRFTEAVPVITVIGSSPPMVHAPVTSSPTPSNSATPQESASGSAPQSSNTGIPPTGSLLNPVIVSADAEAKTIDNGLGNEQTADLHSGVPPTGSFQKPVIVSTETQPMDVDVGIGNEQTAIPDTGISSTSSPKNPSSVSHEAQSTDVNMRLETKQATSANSTENQDVDMEGKATEEETENADVEMKDATTAGEATSADENMVDAKTTREAARVDHDMADAPAVSPAAVEAPATTAPATTPAQPTPAPTPVVSPFARAGLNAKRTAMQWAIDQIYPTPAASPSHTVMINTSMPTLPTPTRPMYSISTSPDGTISPSMDKPDHSNIFGGSTWPFIAL
ncbi:hypothetical protein MMC30_008690 [Trapelia coarctata]|nr:hypothetical protein [Trapelia coarctata]